MWWSVWAKTGRDPHDRSRVIEWLPLPDHLADTAGVCRLLVQNWVSPLVVARIAADIGGGADDVCRLAMWLAAVHDVGKASPAFAVQAIRAQAPTLVDAMREHGLAVDPDLDRDPERSRARHEFVGQYAVRRWLIGELGFGRGIANQLGAVVGGHHGIPAGSSDIALVRTRDDLAGSGQWEIARAAALRWATDLVGGPDALACYAGKRLGRPAQVLLTAIVIIADWIASNVEYFPLEPLHTAREAPRGPDPERTAARVAAAWAQIDLPRRWSPVVPVDARSAFVGRFGRSPRPVQSAAAAAAQDQHVPGMVIIEAPMGEGKTEAALLAAETMAARSGADGCFVALPTRATSDAMFGRVLAWLQSLSGLDTRASVTLAHGTASLNDDYRGLMRSAHVRGVGESQDEVGVAHLWLRGRKKGPLAQFVVGTVDQVLFGALKSRHLMLRHLALVGKVVIIDEVHAYDVFMSRYLDRVLHWLGAYGTPVVLLSATLPAARRAELMHAYESGQSDSPTPIGDDPGYPVVIASGLQPRAVLASGIPRPVVLERAGDELDTLVTLLRSRRAGGGCAVVVRNTVGRVQETADRLVAEFGEQHVTVNHSRYLACDRARTDRELLRRFGPPGPDTDRPDLHIVVASQVVEQSLDVDFDLMISDLAPLDLLLQRMGRLHRHDRPRPAGVDIPRFVLVGVEDWSTVPVRAVPGSRWVYSEHALLRAAALLADRDSVTLPTDIAPLVQEAYDDAVPGPDSWRPALVQAQEAARKADDARRDRAGEFLLGDVGPLSATLEGWVHAGVGDAEETRAGVGQVRDSAETLEVLVVQRDRDGGLLTPAWIERGAGRQIPLDQKVPDDLARVIAACALRLPLAMSLLNEIGDGVIKALERNRYTSFDQSPLLAGRLVLVLDENCTAEIRHGPAAFRVVYDLRRGLLLEQLKPAAG